nr:hypothetical protein [Tanacetum cinerariifolium]
MDPKDNASSGCQYQTSVQSSVRLKVDKTWDHVTQHIKGNGKKTFICNFCHKIIHGGGINRVKKHLVGRKGEVAPCIKVDPDVRYTMEGLLKENDHKLKQKGIEFAESNVISDDDEEQQVREASQPKTGKRKSTTSTHPFFTKGINDASQPTIKKAMQTKEKLHDVMAITMWFYDASIPMNACNSPYFQHAMQKKLVSLLINSYRSQWTESGCTIMSDGWRDIRKRHLINFMVYCSSGISFIKSVDASSIERNAENLCNLFSEIVEMVGVKNVVQMVTDNGANYKAVGILLSERYRIVTGSSCVAHCLNLVLKDVSELDNVKEITTLASMVTAFIYNHKWPLNWLRKRYGWTKIIRPGATRFGTAFIALKSLVDHKNDLQAMVISRDFKKMLRVKNSLDCKQVIMNENFWNNCLITVRVMTPLLRLLRLCDSDFDRENLCKKRKVFQGVLDMAEKHYSGDKLTALNKAIGMFRDSKGNFRRISVVQGRTKQRPDEWWRMFGGDCPILQNFAIRILSQTASSSGCEEEAQGELDYDQLENMLEQEPPSQTQGIVDEDDDDSEFHLLSDRELDVYNTPMSQ